jgi:hypothetical protein
VVYVDHLQLKRKVGLLGLVGWAFVASRQLGRQGLAVTRVCCCSLGVCPKGIQAGGKLSERFWAKPRSVPVVCACSEEPDCEWNLICEDKLFWRIGRCRVLTTLLKASWLAGANPLKGPPPVHISRSFSIQAFMKLRLMLLALDYLVFSASLF